MWPVVRHALAVLEGQSGEGFEYVLLLDPTSPARLPEDVEGAYERLRKHGDADGIVGVSRPGFNPIWHCVVERDGLMASLIEGGERFGRRQDVPPVYRINGSLYLWRAEFVRSESHGWRDGRLLTYEIPETRAMSIDDLEAFERADLLIRHGHIHLPWLG
jgi:N-acylneuraminate cytidylyltransferase